MTTQIPLPQKSLSFRYAKPLIILGGVFNLYSGINQYATHPESAGGKVLGVVFILAGLIPIALGIIMMIPGLPVSPKVVITEDELIFREDIFVRTKRYSWSNIRKLIYGHYLITVQLSDLTQHEIGLDTKPETSIEIKRAIRAVAEKKDIMVSGG